MIRRFAIAAILAICIGAPLVELCDSWDQTANDTEANVLVPALCVGVVLAIGRIVVVACIRALASNSRGFTVTVQSAWLIFTALTVPIPTGRPPTPLRV